MVERRVGVVPVVARRSLLLNQHKKPAAAFGLKRNSSSFPSEQLHRRFVPCCVVDFAGQLLRIDRGGQGPDLASSHTSGRLFANSREPRYWAPASRTPLGVAS